MMKKFLAKSYLYVLLLVLYAPIAIIILFSFTNSKTIGDWRGFSLDLYSNLLSGQAAHSATITQAVLNTLIIAVTAATLSMFLGSIAAVGIFNIRNRKVRKAIQFANNIPMINPDIITGISLFLLFVSLGISGGYVTVVLAHIAFCTPYVVLSVMPRLTRMNPNIYEAALDLGATPFQAFRKVIVPEIKPGMVSGFILAFTLSIDDFAVTLFTKGSDGLETLSTYIYADARKGGLTPELRCLAAIIFLTVLILLLIINRRSRLNKEQ
ncbi:MAG: ABC transporter permease [Bacteroidaceae bacterium]|nr:ABC transporter permease [Bacteroidaceae bacterium]